MDPEGANQIVDERVKEDSLNLNKGKYKMHSFSSDVLIDKREGLPLDIFDHLRNFRHDNVVPHLDFYIQGKRFGRFFDNEGKTMLFDERGHMTHIFEKLIIEYFDMFESLLKQNLILEKFDIDNMFVNIFDRVPTLRVLLTEVTKVPFIGVLNRKLAWDCPPFIGDKGSSHRKNCDVKKLRRYPHNCNDVIKGEYLLSLVAYDHSEIKYLPRHSGLTWPFHENSSQKSCDLKLLQLIIAWEAQRGKVHNVKDFFSYVILLTNCYKHREDRPGDNRAVEVTREATESSRRPKVE
ncbi:hypothetical protein PVAP13_3NG287141 [Panicum virgatum]|uniref:Uncharacterized protein n=1 Tax=Panicum virgatum TaxID=38727 RepID=A0A8T0ULW8_PANVG|nr:hypothetical protein PVAP13_3NG287141 [Panicum virgatum]